MTQLSAHFHSREFACHDGTPAPTRYLHWARLVCWTYLEPLREEFGTVAVISGFRTTTHNRSVGGAPGSYHLSVHGRRGAAVDISCARGRPADWYDFLDKLHAPGLGIYDTHVHVDNRAGHARW